MMKFFSKRPKNLTLISAAAYFFMFAVCAKGVSLYAAQHPSVENLLPVHGMIRDVRLGGQGKSTSLEIESEAGTFRYATYFGKVWPGMRLLQPGDRVDLLAEKKRLNRNRLIKGKQYYIWELIHRQRIIIPYEEVREMVLGKEAKADRFINIWLTTSFAILLLALVRKLVLLQTR